MFQKHEYDDYTGPDVDGAIDLWWRWKTFGSLPFAGGWADQPAYIVDVLEVAEVANKSVTVANNERRASIERQKRATQQRR